MSAAPPRPGRSYVNVRGIVRVDYVKPDGVYWVGWPYDGDRRGGLCVITPIAEFMRDVVDRHGMDEVHCPTPWAA